MAGEPLDNWPEYRRLVLAELERLNAAIIALDAKLDKREQDYNMKMAVVQTDLLTLKIKAGIYGALAGGFFSTVVGIVTTLIWKWPWPAGAGN